jgi:hypothetical protein
MFRQTTESAVCADEPPRRGLRPILAVRRSATKKVHIAKATASPWLAGRPQACRPPCPTSAGVSTDDQDTAALAQFGFNFYVPQPGAPTHAIVMTATLQYNSK